MAGAAPQVTRAPERANERSGPDEDVLEVPAGGRSGRWALILAGAVLACVVAVSAAGLLSEGSKPQSLPKQQSLYQRTMAIAGEYRCPVCAGESAATSDTPAAADIRDLIRKWLEEGQSPAQIRSYLIADYGESILEKPPRLAWTASSGPCRWW